MFQIYSPIFRLSAGAFLATVCLALAPLTGMPAGQEGDPAAAVASLQARYAAVESVTADFEQTYHAPGIEQTESGVLFMKKPGLMRWEYREPEEKLFVADGRDSYLYVPADRQVMVRRFSPEELHSTPLQFLLGRGDIAQSYEVSWEKNFQQRAAGTLALHLTPRRPEAEYAYLVLEFEQRIFDLRRILVKELTGNTSEFFLTNLKTNVRLADNLFQFKIPKGVEVVRIDEK